MTSAAVRTRSPANPSLKGSLPATALREAISSVREKIKAERPVSWFLVSWLLSGPRAILNRVFLVTFICPPEALTALRSSVAAATVMPV